MIPYERQLQILQYLETKEVASIEDFMNLFDSVSESTIRRDLKALEDEGQVLLLRGGGARLKMESYEAPVDTKKNKQVAAKETIAKYAAGLRMAILFIWIPVPLHWRWSNTLRIRRLQLLQRMH